MEGGESANGSRLAWKERRFELWRSRMFSWRFKLPWQGGSKWTGKSGTRGARRYSGGEDLNYPLRRGAFCCCNLLILKLTVISSACKCFIVDMFKSGVMDTFPNKTKFYRKWWKAVPLIYHDKITIFSQWALSMIIKNPCISGNSYNWIQYLKE